MKKTTLALIAASIVAQIGAGQAADEGIDVSDCYPPGSTARKDYDFAAGWAFHLMQKRGELIRVS